MDRCTVYGLLTSLIWLSVYMKADCKQIQSSPGKCELYSGSSCIDYLKGKFVFVKNGENLNAVEEGVRKLFQTAKIGVSDQCWPHAKVLICFHTFPVCGSDNKLPVNRLFCQDECRFLEKFVCKREFALAKRINTIRDFVPYCETLPRPGSSAHADCWKLPSLDNANFTWKPSVAYVTNSRGFYQKRALLKCFFNVYRFGKRSPKVDVRWYKNGTEIDIRMKRYKLKRRHRENFLLVSILTIKQSTYEDAGRYDCIARQGKSSAQSGVYLSVVKDNGRAKPKTGRGNRPQDPFGKLGKCVPYEGKVCAKYLKGNGRVFEYSFTPQGFVETKLALEFARLKEKKQFSERCLDMTFAVMCLTVFQACNNSAVSPASRLCYEDCHTFDNVHCKYEVEMAQKHSSASEFLPECKLLPKDNKLCEPIQQFLLGSNSSNTNSTKCYKGVGDEYDGKVNMSKSGQPCSPWINHSSVHKFTHNFCRNFRGENFAPWCYVANGKKEFCNIPKCDSEVTGSIPKSVTVPIEKGDDERYTTCFHGKGEGYRGQVKTSLSGKPCLQWDAVDSYRESHSYCRNYGGEREAPWCFTTKDKKEYCDIPKCTLASSKTRDGDSGSLVYYVVVVAIALSVLLLVVLILLVYLKQRKKGEPVNGTAGQMLNGKTLVARVSKEDIGAPRVPGPLDKQVPEVNDCSVNFIELIGKGFFMDLWKAELIEAENIVTPLLVKRLSPDATKSLMNAFNLEISTVRGLDHPNIPELLCISSQDAVPFLGYGGDSERDLKTCLSNSKAGSDTASRFQPVDFDVLIDMSVQIANGLAYLHENNIVHKDVGTRSCLIENDGVIKLAHFGIGLYLHPGDYYHDNYMTLPARWMSPETLQTKTFDKSNDVWSFGVLLWELFSYAEKPYGNFSDKEAMNLISSGQLLTCPDDCPASLYSLMKDCWTIKSTERISLDDVLKRLNSWNGTIC